MISIKNRKILPSRFQKEVNKVKKKKINFKKLNKNLN